ncbi:non-reducing end alpha-L-arabinofuranosidase family hydrolase [Kribbella albertanoniae]|uniref:non-reducing end alpha-L-arabinofuranosidase n=1 Tax=Kribbella albertanoniae TaxID=1266829 RepID=A0A4R4Q4W3_9ACTN|nr:non-reducing end alpha-L-arabinofuranosidase family hydrolase [Kribbella albertanoniae]TDC29873.1 alpha-L-arabinofuranosidase [Kribbella albertanoniae]
MHRTKAIVLAMALALVAGLVAAISAIPAHAATVDPNAWYVLVNRASGKAVDISGASTADGAAAQQWTRHDGTNQQFQFVDSGGGYYKLRARHSAKALDVFNASTADGAAIVQWTEHNGGNQQFRLADSPDGYVRLINRTSNKTLEIPSGSTANGATIAQRSDSGATNQQWQLVRLDSNPSGPLPSTFQWSSSGVLAGPKADAQHPNRYSVKDFSVVRHNNQWLVYATTAGANGWGLVNFNFSDWSQAAAAPHTYLDTASAIGPGYRAAPQLFHFAPQNLWYLVYQTAPPTYSTSTNPADPRSWSAPKTFIAQEPEIVRQNKGDGTWIDFWVICDTANCFLFFSDDNGHIYRAQTTLANYPNGFGNTQIVLSDSKFALFEATNVYKVSGSNQYLLMQEAIGGTGRRYFRSFTSTSLTGNWTPLAATESQPFAGRNNVTFPNGAWTQDISHGELVRASNDQTLTINPCNLQFIYQGQDPGAGGDYLKLPWRMGLLTQTNSTC